MERIETPRWDRIALREAVINAIVHNDYTFEVPPKFEIFPDRIEITSAGRLPEALSREEFFSGISIPRNKELMRIYRDVELVESLGSGVPRILRSYGEECFTITDNFVRITFPSAWKEDEKIPESETDAIAAQASAQNTAQAGGRNTAHVDVRNLKENEDVTIVDVEVGEARRVGQNTAQVGGQDTAQVDAQISVQVGQLLLAMKGTMPREALQASAGIAHREHFRKDYLLPALKAGYIELTIPDKPNSSRQEYRLTEKGRRMQKRLRRKGNKAT